MITALFLFCAIVIFAIAAGAYFGFWSNILPHLFESGGPGGLAPDFGVGLVTEGVSAVVQILIAFLIFDLVANSHRRKIERRHKRLIADKIVEHYYKFLESEPNVRWPIPADSIFQNKLNTRLYELLLTNAAGLNEETRSHIRKANENFEALFFSGPNSLANREKTDAVNNILLHLKAALKNMRYGNKLFFFPNRERVNELKRLKKSIRSKLIDYYDMLPDFFDSEITAKLDCVEPETGKYNSGV